MKTFNEKKGVGVKHFIRDSIILFYSAIGKIGRYRRKVAAEQPLLRVVAIHDVTDPEWFRSVIDLLDTRYHLITPDDLLTGNLASEGINVLLTFDDGYESWLSHVVPVLRDYEAKGIFFVSSGLLEVADDEPNRAPPSPGRVPRCSLSMDIRSEATRSTTETWPRLRRPSGRTRCSMISIASKHSAS